MVRPVIGIIGNPHLINSEYLVHGAGEMNSRAVREICNALPVIVPPDALLAPIEELMDPVLVAIARTLWTVAEVVTSLSLRTSSRVNVREGPHETRSAFIETLVTRGSSSLR